MESLRQILAVLAVLALLGGTLYFLRTRGIARVATTRLGRASNKRMQLIEQLRLTPQHSIHLVSVGGQELLVAVSPGACSILDTATRIELNEKTVNR